MLIPHVPAPHRAMLPQGKMRGSTPWVLAMLLVLTMLMAAVSLSLGRAASGISGTIAGRVTLQIVTPDPQERLSQTKKIHQIIAAEPYVQQAHIIEASELTEVLEQWFGSDGSADDPVLRSLPLPSLIDVDFIRGSSQRQLERLRRAVQNVTQDVRIIPHAEWLEPVARLFRSIAWIAALLVVAVGCASAAIVSMSVHTVLGANFATIEILHLIGASDQQITTLLQRQITSDCVYGIIFGALVAFLLAALLAWLSRQVTAGFADTMALGIEGWLFLLALPMIAIVIAALTIRITLLRALEKML